MRHFLHTACAAAALIVAAAAPAHGDKPNEFRVDWNGKTLFDQTDMPKQGYAAYSFPVQATGPSSTLTFYGRNDPGYLSLDDVSVSSGAAPPVPPAPPAAPEPSSLA